MSGPTDDADGAERGAEAEVEADGPADAATGEDPADAAAGGDEASELDAADAFSLLGDATRLATVTALHDEPDPPVPFSTLYERVGASDSGQFSYHLDRLVPHFVEKTEDGYVLASAGERIARAVSAGVYTESPRLEPFELEGACLDCGEEALWGSYEDERFRIECRACEATILRVRTPPSLVRGRSPTEFVEAFQRWSWTGVAQAVQGICPECGGTVDPYVDDDPGESLALGATALFSCTVCGRTVATSFGGVAVNDPTVRAFHERRGDPLADRHYWTVDQFVSDEHVEVLDRAPWRVRVSFFADGDACHVLIDGDLEVVETTVVPDGAPEA